MKKILSQISKNNLLEIATLAAIVLFAVSFLLKITAGMTMFGLTLLFYFPGKILIELIPSAISKIGKIGKIAYASIFSFALTSMVGYITQNKFGFSSNQQIIAIIALNILILIIFSILSRLKPWKNMVQPKDEYTIGLSDYLAISGLFVAILITIIMNPVGQNYDNYLALLKLSDLNNINLTGMRFTFISALELATRFTNLNMAFVYRNLLNLLFFVSTLAFYDYIRRMISDKKFVALTYLSLLAAPAILVQINYTMPQVVLLVFTIPCLILLTESLRSKQILPAIIALVLGLVSLTFHQLSAIMVSISLITIAIHLARLIFIERRITITHIVLFVLIVAPWFKILNLWHFFNPVVLIFEFALDNFKRLTWHWWFLNNYTDIDGEAVGFTGINAVFYYLYNGILPLITIIYLVASTLSKRFRVGIEVIPAILYFGFFFAAAEILPRIGLIMLPSRAWPHMMIPLVILIVPYSATLIKNKFNTKIYIIALIAIILIGYVGTIFLTAKNIKKVYRSELPVAEYMKNNLPKDAVVISSQDNNAIVNIYADRYYFGRIMAEDKLDRNEFEKLINQTLDTLEKNKNYIIQPKINRFLDTPDFNHNEIYFVYCNSQLTAINNANTDRQSFSDAINRDTYANLGYAVSYQDKNCTLIKVR